MVNRKTKKQSKTNTKSRSSKKSKSTSCRKPRSKSNVMKGGDDGRYVLPKSYFGQGTSGYHASGSAALAESGKNHNVSQGTIWGNGMLAGPNMYPGMSGGNCGCKRKSKSKSKSKKSKSSK